MSLGEQLASSYPEKRDDLDAWRETGGDLGSCQGIVGGKTWGMMTDLRCLVSWGGLDLVCLDELVNCREQLLLPDLEPASLDDLDQVSLGELVSFREQLLLIDLDLDS